MWFDAAFRLSFTLRLSSDESLCFWYKRITVPRERKGGKINVTRSLPDATERQQKDSQDRLVCNNAFITPGFVDLSCATMRLHGDNADHIFFLAKLRLFTPTKKFWHILWLRALNWFYRNVRGFPLSHTKCCLKRFCRLGLRMLMIEVRIVIITSNQVMLCICLCAWSVAKYNVVWASHYQNNTSPIWAQIVVETLLVLCVTREMRVFKLLKGRRQ